ncbi:D-glycerate dehydrogenase, partial [Acidimicrobiaceae bacterium USS-CC1]|nr:D-glycerate dehydrogenase [Acidiferrimicrobium australe]
PSLRIVANVAVGYDNIDVAGAAARGVLVTNTPGVLTEATADLAMGLLLAVARRIPEADAAVRGGRFPPWGLFQELIGLDVAGACLGIVGLGRIGRAVARRAALGFGMRVVYAGGAPDPSDAWAAGAERVGFGELLARADFVSLHAPLTPATRHLVDEAALRAMQPGAVLVNTARGPLVDEAALARALTGGWIAGAGLDVFEREPEVEAALLASRRAVLTPHLGSATARTRLRMCATAVDNVLAVAAGAVPPNLVAHG